MLPPADRRRFSWMTWLACGRCWFSHHSVKFAQLVEGLSNVTHRSHQGRSSSNLVTSGTLSSLISFSRLFDLLRRGLVLRFRDARFMGGCLCPSAILQSFLGHLSITSPSSSSPVAAVRGCVRLALGNKPRTVNLPTRRPCTHAAPPRCHCRRG